MVTTAAEGKIYISQYDALRLEIIVPETRRARQFLVSLPEREATGYTRSVVPLTRAVWALVLDFARENKLKIEYDDQASQMCAMYAAQQVIQRKNSEDYLAYKAAKIVPPLEHLNLRPPGDDLELRPFQKVACNSASRSIGYGLFFQQGCGKTPTAIARACEIAMQNMEVGLKTRVFVACPKAVKQNWRNEFKRFATVPTSCHILRGDPVQRFQSLTYALASRAELQVVIGNYQNIGNTQGVLNFNWDLGILDEAHTIRTPSTHFCKNAFKLRDRCTYRLPLTGTPVVNYPWDLWALFEFMEEGLSGFTSFNAFKKFFGVFDTREGSPHKVLVSLQNIPVLRELLAENAFIITKEEALPDLPEKVYDVHEVELTSDQRVAYDTLAQNLALEIQADLNNAQGASANIVVQNILTKLLRLAQICAGFLGISEEIDEITGEVLQEKTVRRFEKNPKLDELIGIIKESDPLSKVIVWSCWEEDINTIMARLAKEGIKAVKYTGKCSDAQRKAAEEDFNLDPAVKVFVGNQAAGGTGLNLHGYDIHTPAESHTNCDLVVYYSCNWSPVHRAQSEDRAHRIGTRQHVRIVDLCVPGTIDEEIRVRVLGKIAAALELQDVQELLQQFIHNPVSQVS